MILIKCSKCKNKVLKYKKIGKGRILRCYKSRIIKYYTDQNPKEIRCSCGQLIGIDEGKWFKMKQQMFNYSGAITKG